MPEDTKPDDKTKAARKPPRGHSPDKEAQILTGARSVFIEHGFEGASIDEIARAAGVSKPTLYRYFADKRSLYSAIVTQECDLYAQQLFPLDLDRMEVRPALERVARQYLELILSDKALGAFRVTIGDAQRFPALARAFYAAGPGQGARRLSDILQSFVDRGDLDIPDVPLAAFQFIELCKADAFYKRVFGLIEDVTPEARERVQKGAVDMFLRAYGTRAG